MNFDQIKIGKPNYTKLVRISANIAILTSLS